MGSFSLGVVGATGAVGRKMIQVLEEKNLKPKELKLLASKRSVGQKVEAFGENHEVIEAKKENFKGLDYILFATGGSISKELVPAAKEQGAVAIDNSSYFRLFDDVPLIVPEVNPEDAKKHNGIIANPNCSTTQMLVSLKPLHDYANIRRVIVSTYQAVSGSGKEGVDELRRNAALSLAGMKGEEEVYQHEIAFNAIPHIDKFNENGYTGEEMKMVNETQKMLDPNIKVSVTCVRVPVFNGHGEAINVETEKRVTREKAIELFENTEGLEVIDDPQNDRYPLQLELDDKDGVFVGRIREDDTVEYGLNFWNVADNLRKGAATNAVQILELLV
ncbi:aspartate-semialdehyde dehydrogenase [Natranaerofaba carboxydovora]|uniref:aspartate-semialdehyde dehydrogenase n=1 Tax=Natranaerofaba carboxydovora TaxID=2742683 RepID=UPI001F12E514|nr:aspartate-semialdehyde dehydrogenase [Natranaerofaba carboxydovora]UMZ73220.1 Aspartate-semialdehyde dehydrogenase 2 [Natranaerofaba carboxydovora]